MNHPLNLPLFFSNKFNTVYKCFHLINSRVVNFINSSIIDRIIKEGRVKPVEILRQFQGIINEKYEHIQVSY